MSNPCGCVNPKCETCLFYEAALELDRRNIDEEIRRELNDEEVP